MKLFILSFFAVVLSAGLADARQKKDELKYDLGADLVDFGAPSVQSIGNMPTNTPIGSIVFEVSSNTFQGLVSSGAGSSTLGWTPLSAPSAGGFVPTGTILPFGGTTAPAGYVMCDGTSYTATGTYAALYGVIGNTYGGTPPNFNVPDCRGIFLRGAGTTNRSAGKDANNAYYSATLGTYSQDQSQGHYHSFGGTSNSAAFNLMSAASASFGGIAVGNTASLGTVSISSPIGDGTNGTPRMGVETQPANLAVNYIIKL